MTKEYMNPSVLFPSQQYGFSQIVTATPGKLVYLSGQVGWDENQELTGDAGFRAQTRQALKNIDLAMSTAGGALSDVVSMRIYIVASEMEKNGHHVREALQDFFATDKAPATTWIGINCLAQPEFLIEIEATGIIDTS